MPRNGSGVYSLPAGYLAVTGQSATATQHNTPLEDIASEITASLPVAGTKAMTGNLAMGGNKITGLADGTQVTDAACYGQLGAWVPAGIVVPYAGTSAPNGWLLCYGQAVSRSTYNSLFAAIGTTYGSGDGSTTFNLPDLRGRVVAGKDDMGGTSANRITNLINGDTIGAAGGFDTHTLTSGEMPSHSHTATVTDPGHSHTYVRYNSQETRQAGGASGNLWRDDLATLTGSATTGITVSNANTGGDGAHNNLQPTFILNYIIRS